MILGLILGAIRGGTAGALAAVIGCGLHEMGATPLLAAGVAALVYVVLAWGRELFLDRY